MLRLLVEFRAALNRRENGNRAWQIQAELTIGRCGAFLNWIPCWLIELVNQLKQATGRALAHGAEVLLYHMARRKTLMAKALMVALCLACLTAVAAQTNFTAISNFGSEVQSYANVSMDNPIAVSFTSGTIASELLGVSVSMHDSTSPPEFDFQPISLSLYRDVGGSPADRLAVLFGADYPTNGGIYTYTNKSALLLSANSTYWIIESTSGPGWYDWNLTTNTSIEADHSWKLGVMETIDGSSWTTNGNLGYYPQFSVIVSSAKLSVIHRPFAYPGGILIARRSAAKRQPRVMSGRWHFQFRS